MNEAVKRYGYPETDIRFGIFVGRFRANEEASITAHLHNIKDGAGPVKVYNLQMIIAGLIDAAKSKTYINDPVIVTIKALQEAGVLCPD